MRLKSLELELEWPLAIPIQGLRILVIEHLENYGAPLRWAITSINTSENSDCSRHLKVEAVVILS